jgi:hypothetical protein
MDDAGIFLAEQRQMGCVVAPLRCRPMSPLGHLDGAPSDDQGACYCLSCVTISCWPSRCPRHGCGIRGARRVYRAGLRSSWVWPGLSSRVRVPHQVSPRVRASSLCPSWVLPGPSVLPATVFWTRCCGSAGRRRFGRCSVAWLPVACLPMARICLAWTARRCGTLVDRRRGRRDGDTYRLDLRGSSSAPSRCGTAAVLPKVEAVQVKLRQRFVAVASACRRCGGPLTSTRI